MLFHLVSSKEVCSAGVDGRSILFDGVERASSGMFMMPLLKVVLTNYICQCRHQRQLRFILVPALNRKTGDAEAEVTIKQTTGSDEYCLGVAILYCKLLYLNVWLNHNKTSNHHYFVIK